MATRPDNLLRVAIVGDDESGTARHDAAIRSVSGLCRTDRLEEADIVSICHRRLEERSFACEQALCRGQRVVSLAPVTTDRGDADRLVRVAQQHGASLEWEEPAVTSGFADTVLRQVEQHRGLVYATLHVTIPRTWVPSRGPGILMLHGLWMMPLIERLFGPADTVAAHTRTLVALDSMAEDLALAQIEFVNGMEATIQAHSLASPEAVGYIGFAAWGGETDVQVRTDLPTARSRGLTRQYQHLRDGTGSSSFDIRLALHGARWVSQAARHRVRVHRREVNR